MPELPEVSVVVNYLKKNIIEKKVMDVLVLKEKLLKNTNENELKNVLINQCVTNVRRRGKYIILDFEQNTLVIHLRMEGKLRLEGSNFESLKHDYIYFKFTDKSELIYNDTRMFGTFELVGLLDEQSLKGISKLGLEYDDKNLTPNLLYSLTRNKKQAIKTTLLSQDLFVGLGNIYVDEVLFAAKIHPLRPSCSISIFEFDLIISFSQSIMNESIKHGGSSVKTYTSGNMKKGTYQNYLKVYGKYGETCPRCGVTKIEKIKVNGRGTHFCPFCQEF